MKHFRDLVLSTREPVLHNVLWIKPTGIATYIVYMYEDGWKPLFGGGSGDDSGISYNIIREVSDGYIVQFIDNRDPDNVKNLYPKTKAVQVWLSNGINVEEAINNINRALSEINLMIKKARFVTLYLLNQEHVKKGNTYWVYDSYNEDTGQYIGEPILRKYTSESAYTSISLITADIVMNIRPTAAKLAYVESLSMSDNGKVANMQLVATKSDLNAQIENLINRIISDVLVDGDSVVVNGVANIKPSKRRVYIVTSDIFALEYSTSEDRANKIFLIRTIGGHPTDGTSLIKYDDTGLEENVQTILLLAGDLLFNIDEHYSGNDDILPYTLYVYDKPQDSIKIHPIATKELVEEWVGDSITSAIESVSNVYLTFSVNNLNIVGTSVTISLVYSYANDAKRVYADITTPDIHIILPLNVVNSTLCIFSGSIDGYEYTLKGHTSSQDFWSFIKIELQSKLTFDTTPVEDSTNPVTSEGIAETLKKYVLLDTTDPILQPTSYNHRMAATPKYYRVEWLENQQDPENPGVIPYIDDPSIIPPERRFKNVWESIYNSLLTIRDLDIYTPKLLLYNGVPACYSETENLNSVTGYEFATYFILKFFNGSQVITYRADKDRDAGNNIILRVTKTILNVTLT